MAKTQIIVQPRPKERGIAHEESKLQARMVMKFAEIWPTAAATYSLHSKR